MKKILVLILCTLMLLSLVACGGNGDGASSTTEGAPTLMVGYYKSSIVPKSPMALSSSDQPTYSAVYEDVFATCIAITDVEGETLLMFTIDISYSSSNTRISLLRAVEEATGVPSGNMTYSCTHNHSGLDPSAGAVNVIKEAMVEAATNALADRAPATLSIGTTQTENMNFVRHYTTEDGYWVGDGYYSPTGTNLKYIMEEADSTVQLMKFTREGKAPVLLMNWQAHANYSYKMEHLNADFIGGLRQKVEAETDCLFAYFQGAAGNLNPWDQTGKYNKFERSLSGMTLYGNALADFVIPALDNMTPVNADDLDIMHKTLTLEVRRDSTEVIEAAAAFRQAKKEGATTTEAIQAANGLIRGSSGAEYVPYRVSFGESVDAEISAIRLGDVGFAVAPYEMFDTNGIFIKENSPMEMTFILGYTNGRLFYIPSADCIEHGCYEWEGGLFVPGTAELLADEYVAMLTELYSAK